MLRAFAPVCRLIISPTRIAAIMTNMSRRVAPGVVSEGGWGKCGRRPDVVASGYRRYASFPVPLRGVTLLSVMMKAPVVKR
jgi:hypothetical protein